MRICIVLRITQLEASEGLDRAVGPIGQATPPAWQDLLRKAEFLVFQGAFRLETQDRIGCSTAG